MIQLPEKQVVQRRKNIIKLVSPLIKDKNHIDVKQVAGSDFTYAVVARGQNDVSSVRPDMIRVETKVHRVYFNYYEAWRPSPSEDLLSLERSYMHLYRKTAQSLDEKQIFCLHCDPMLKNSDSSYKYKRAPHIHLLGATPNIDRAHISICLRNPDEVVENIEILMNLMSDTMLMISKEVFPSYERYGYIV